MSPERYKRVNALFLEAVELDPRERESFLQSACGDDAELRREVASLLSYDSDQTIIAPEQPQAPDAGSVDIASASRRPRRWFGFRWLTPYLSPTGQLALGAFVTIAMLIPLGLLVEYTLNSFQRKLRAAALNEILNAKAVGLEMLMEHEQERVESWTRSRELRDLVVQLVDSADDENSAETLQTSPLQDELREVIERFTGEETVFQVWDRRYTTMADEPERAAIGSGVTPFGAAALADAFAGRATVRTYDDDQHISTYSSKFLRVPHAGTLAPVRDSKGEIVAALMVIDVDAHDQAAGIFRLGNLGASGETYAFNRQGLLLTESRFTAQLQAIGLMPPGEDVHSRRVVRLSDPGGDMTEGYRPSEPLAARPLTKMAEYATAGIDGVDVHGYRDYRGRVVVGAWRWLDEYQCGIATEVDKDEVEPGFWLVKFIAWVSVGAFAVCLGVLVYSFYSVHRLRQEVGRHSQVGQYTLEERIGEGGMGSVYRARHVHLKRPTAVKLLKPDLLDKQSIARFEREAQLASQLTHPNTIQIYDYGVTESGLFYYVMEYVEGPSLAAEVEQRGPLAVARFVHVLQQVCGSLIEAHAANLVHRDLKPQNIMLCRRGGVDDVVKVLDFGLVKHLHTRESRQVTASGLVAGTPLYIAPERLRDAEQVSAATDIYSLGAVAFFLLTGRDVFQGPTVADLLFQTLHVEPPRPSDVRSDIPESLDALVLACLAKDPERRPASAAELLAQLQQGVVK